MVPEEEGALVRRYADGVTAAVVVGEISATVVGGSRREKLAEELAELASRVG